MTALASVLACGALALAGCGTDPQADYNSAMGRVDFETEAFAISGSCLALSMPAKDAAHQERADELAINAISAAADNLARMVKEAPSTTFTTTAGEARSLDQWVAELYSGACTEAQVVLEAKGLTGQPG